MSKRKTVGPGGREYLVLVKDFRAAGYLPEAMVNFLARVGWSYDDHTELFTRQELIERFSLSGLNASPARFDYDRLEWMAGIYMRDADPDTLARQLLPFYRQAGLDADLETVRRLVPLLQPRIKKLPDALPISSFVFQDTIAVDMELLVPPKVDAAVTREGLRRARALLAAQELFAPEALEEPLRELAAEMGLKVGTLFGMLRGAVTGQKVSPPLLETMAVMGRDKTLRRIDDALAML